MVTLKIGKDWLCYQLMDCGVPTDHSLHCRGWQQTYLLIQLDSRRRERLPILQVSEGAWFSSLVRPLGSPLFAIVLHTSCLSVLLYVVVLWTAVC